MHKRLTKRRTSALAILLSTLLSTSSALATEITGRVAGVVTNVEHQPIVGALVTMQSPAQTLVTTTRADGSYTFASLIPDVYELTVHREGYADTRLSDINVQADILRDESPTLLTNIKEIGRTTVQARSRSGLVQPGVSADVYSINAAQIDATSAFGGGSNRDSITSSLATVPGVTVPLGQSGFAQSVLLRGGDYEQTGYEFDGVPLNRNFDQYAQSPLSSLGTSELQVYTGSAPIDQQASGIGGYVNQVIKSGTFPRTVNVDLGVGTPAFYNKAKIEFSGANGPDKTFTYYLAASGYDFSQRIIDQYNGASLTPVYGPITAAATDGCGPNNPGPCYPNNYGSNYIGGLPIRPNGYTTAPTFFGQQPAGTDREAVANFHLSIPHHHDAAKDDLQFLYANSYYVSHPNASLADLGAAASSLPTPPFYIDENSYSGPLGAILTPTNLTQISNAYFPGPARAAYNAPLEVTQDDSHTTSLSLAKLAFRHTIGTKAFARVSLYEVSSDESQNGIVGVFQPYFSGPDQPNYTAHTTTSGIDTAFTDQISSKHLASVDLGRSVSLTRRRNDFTSGLGGSSPIALLVNATNPTGGCYGVDTNNGTFLADCAGSQAASYGLPPISAPGAGYALVPASGSPDIATAGTLGCGSGPCSYFTVSNGANADLNAVRTRFTNFSLADHWHLTDKLALDLGLRYDDFLYLAADTNSPQNQLFVNTFNQLNCISGTTIMSKTDPTQPCSAVGPGYTAANLTAESHNLDYQELSPRFGATLALDPKNVLRFAYGRYIQPPLAGTVQSASEQAFYPSPSFYSAFGFNSPTREIKPETSDNLDLSWEHQFADLSTSAKITPFYRTTQNELVAIPVDPKTNFVAYVNGLNRQSSGVELAIKHGDFKKNGISAALAYTYTHTVAHYPTTATGGSVVASANQAIQTFNGYTQYCASNPKDVRCPSAAVQAGPCYSGAAAAGNALTSSGVATACGPGTIANPYWNAAPAALLDPSAGYAAYNGPLGAGAYGTSTSYAVPHVASLVMNYRHNRFAVAPSFQFEAGARYGSPFAAQGVAPDSCTAGLNSSVVGDPRYPGGTAGTAAGAPYDASSCYGTITVPNPSTKQFDGIGAFRQPSLLTMNLQMSYDASPNATIELTGVNIFHRCFGGSKVPWSSGATSCNYAQSSPYVGNFYNPGDAIQALAQYPYAPVFATNVQANSAGPALPFQLYADVKFKL